MDGCIRIPLGTEVGLGQSDIVLDGDPAPPKGAQPPFFSPCLLWLTRYGDGAGNTVEENSSIFSLIRMH